MNFRRYPWIGLIVLGTMLVLVGNMQAEEQTLPEELSFLKETEPPDYLFVAGEILTTDSSGIPLTTMPFRFYWEKGQYAFDARYFGGALLIFARGIADTVWVYDFWHDLMVISLRNQSMGQVTGLPFSPRDILPIFSIYTEGNLNDFVKVETVNSEVIVSLSDGSRYYFDEESKQLKRSTKGTRTLTFTNYETHKGFTLPYTVTFNQGFLRAEAITTQLRVKQMSLKPQDENNLLLSKEPLNMQRAFDLRPSED